MDAARQQGIAGAATAVSDAKKTLGASTASYTEALDKRENVALASIGTRKAAANAKALHAVKVSELATAVANQATAFALF